MKNYEKCAFQDKLKNSNLEDVYNCSNVESAWNAFKCIFTSVLDDYAPEKEIKMKQRTEIWMNSEIL